MANDPLWTALARVWLLEDCPEATEALHDLADLVVEGFHLYPRHQRALADEAAWRDASEEEALRNLALGAVGEAVTITTLPEPFLRLACRALERALEPPGSSRRHEDDPERRTPLEDAELVSPLPSPEENLAAVELEEGVLDCPDLTDGERAVVSSRMRLGATATAAEIAAEIGSTEGSVRQLAKRAREKLVHISPDSVS